MKKLGTYRYKHPMYSRSSRAYQQFEMRVEVVAERGNKYQIKYNGFHASGAAPGSLHWVRKDKVRLDDEVYNGDIAAVNIKAVIENGRAKFYVAEVRLPYKDQDYED